MIPELMPGPELMPELVMAKPIPPDDVFDPARPAPRPTSGLGLASLIVGLLCLLVAWVPFVGCLALPLAGIGLVMGVVGCILASGGRAGMGLPIGGVASCLVALVLPFAMMSLIRRSLPSLPTSSAEIRVAETPQASAVNDTPVAPLMLVSEPEPVPADADAPTAAEPTLVVESEDSTEASAMPAAGSSTTINLRLPEIRITPPAPKRPDPSSFRRASDPHQDATLCGAPTKSGGKCKNPVKGGGRCHLHK